MATPTPKQLAQADLIYKHIYYWVLMNAKDSGWFDEILPDGAIEKLVGAAAVAACAEVYRGLSADIS